MLRYMNFETFSPERRSPSPYLYAHGGAPQPVAGQAGAHHLEGRLGRVKGQECGSSCTALNDGNLVNKEEKDVCKLYELLSRHFFSFSLVAGSEFLVG